MKKENFLQSDVALYGMFISTALVVSYIEALIPIPMPVPGMKLGLANVVIVWILYSMNLKAAAIVSIIRVALMGLLFGNLYSLLFSMVGAVLSLTVMYFLKRIPKFTVIGVSIAGAVCHNLGQIIVAAIILNNIRIAYYFPVLILTGVVAGIVIGILGGILYKKIKILQTNVHM